MLQLLSYAGQAMVVFCALALCCFGAYFVLKATFNFAFVPALKVLRVYKVFLGFCVWHRMGRAARDLPHPTDVSIILSDILDLTQPELNGVPAESPGKRLKLIRGRAETALHKIAAQAKRKGTRS